jgi:3-hydroxyacyl-CoA dehydrogenase
MEDDAIRSGGCAWPSDVVIASIKTKMHAISPDVAEGLSQAVDLAEASYQGVVIWSGDEPFSAGADLQAMLPGFMMGGAAAINEAEGELQRIMLKAALRQRAGGAAVRGLALGGGCELAVHSAPAACCTWKATWAWWKWAWAWCPVPVA